MGGSKRLVECERRIERGFKEIGVALKEIRDERLYKEAGYTSFDSYCPQRWDMSANKAYKLIESAKVIDALCTNGTHDQLPTSERQTRELARIKDENGNLDGEEIQEVWKEVNEKREKPTAKAIRDVKKLREDLEAKLNDAPARPKTNVMPDFKELREELHQLVLTLRRVELSESDKALIRQSHLPKFIEWINEIKEIAGYERD